jgi:inner membrane protein
MDPITQAALGAAVGHACVGKQLGYRRAALWGAVAGVFPDIDTFVTGMISEDPLVRLQLHRAITHSVFFAPVIGPFWGWLLWRRSRDGPATGYWPWLVLMTVALWSHPLLDACTHYGTQLLSPFTDRRFAFPAIPVIDPRYTLILFAGLAVAAWLPPRRAQLLTSLALLISTAYLFLGLKLNADAENWARMDLASRGVIASEVHAFPTLFQLPLRRVVARTPSEDLIGFVSMAQPCPIRWGRQPRESNAAFAAFRATPEAQIFDWFANELTTHYRDGGKLILGDLRYGFTNDARQGFWRLEASLYPDGALGRPMYQRDARPPASWANILNLWEQAYPASCSEFTGTLLITE